MLALLLLVLSACFDDVPVIEVSGRAGDVVVPPIPMESTDDVATYRWEVVEAVEGSFVSGTIATTPRPSFQFDRRGQYLLDRWIRSGLSERLTHHVVVTIEGVAPLASINGPTFVAVGAESRFDASLSSSLEDRELLPHWRLVVRPGLSQASLPTDEVDGPTVTLVPDVAGEYRLQLRVFDGELWSDPDVTVISAHD